MDDDNPPRKNPIDLIFYDLDVIGCPTPVWANILKGSYPIYWNALKKVGEEGYRPYTPKDGEEITEVDAIGSGCLVIARRVFEKLKFSKPFLRGYDEKGKVNKGGDYSFCDKVREEGFKIYAHFGYLCMHFNELELGEVIDAFVRYFNPEK